jgi:hypothetical protein
MVMMLKPMQPVELLRTICLPDAGQMIFDRAATCPS